MMYLYYKITLYLNIFKYKIRDIFKSIENNENLIFLRKYFKKKNIGFYIDVGCYHPIRLSNTAFLYKKGWSGMNIDISKKSIDLFNICRPRDINLNYGVSNINKLSNYFYNKDLFHSNTLNLKFSQSFLNKNNIKKKKIKIKTLNNLIDIYASNVKKIDLIDIDAEGVDLDVLKGIDFKKYNIDLIMIEVHYYDKTTKSNAIKIKKILNKNNFKLLYGKFPGNCIFKYRI